MTKGRPNTRAGVALLIAALPAEDASHIINIHQIDRGYQNIDGCLRQLGAVIERVYFFAFFNKCRFCFHRCAISRFR